MHRRIRPVVAQFVRGAHRRSPKTCRRFDQAIASALRVRNSVIAEVALLVAVYTLGLWASQQQILALGAASWYATPDAAQMHLTPAGYWYVFVSVPLFQFILLRWYFRFFLWFWFLWRVSRLNLRLRPIHPDRAAGLGFLGGSIDAFAPDPLRPERPAGRTARQPRSSMRDETRWASRWRWRLPGLLHGLVVGPLTVFAPSLWRARRDGTGRLRQPGQPVCRRVRGEVARWQATRDQPLPGSADVQSLSDLGNSYRVIQDTRLVPFGWKDVTWLAAVAALPLLPFAADRPVGGRPGGPVDQGVALTSGRHGSHPERRDGHEANRVGRTCSCSAW